MTGAPENPATPLALLGQIAGSGSLDRLVDTACGYADHAIAKNTRIAYTRDWAAFARWCRMKGTDPLTPLPRIDRPIRH